MVSTKTSRSIRIVWYHPFSKGRYCVQRLKDLFAKTIMYERIGTSQTKRNAEGSLIFASYPAYVFPWDWTEWQRSGFVCEKRPERQAQDLHLTTHKHTQNTHENWVERNECAWMCLNVCRRTFIRCNVAHGVPTSGKHSGQLLQWFFLVCCDFIMEIKHSIWTESG
jgi:hypothetical protein